MDATRRPTFLIVLAGLLFITAASQVHATSIRYTVASTVGAFDDGDPAGLEGATLTFVYEFDAAALTPTLDHSPSFANRETQWPVTNTTISLSVSGSTSSDGTYAGAVYGVSGWQFLDKYTGTAGNPDVVASPMVSFMIGGYEVTSHPGTRYLLSSFNTPPPPGTILPYEFNESDLPPAQLIQDQQGWLSYGSSQAGLVGNSNAQFLTVPEPNAVALLLLTGILTAGVRATPSWSGVRSSWSSEKPADSPL